MGIQSFTLGLNYIGFALALILASGLILSFVGDSGERMRLFLRFSPKYYVFFEISKNALALADGIKNKPKKPSYSVGQKTQARI